MKDQGQCGSCTAFAVTAVVETCYRKLTGKFGIYSEQQLMDCAYGYHGANGCKGAALNAYMYWAETKQRLAGSAQYPYKAKEGPCNTRALMLDPKVMVQNVHYKYDSTEDFLKSMVAEHSAVATTIWFTNKTRDALYAYKSGVFNGCTPRGVNSTNGHVVAVVGYGKENKQDYWLIKNSWASNWGEKGFLKLRRGVDACAVGREIGVIKCGPYPTKVRVAALDCEEGDESCAAEQEEGEDGDAEDGNTEEGDAEDENTEDA